MELHPMLDFDTIPNTGLWYVMTTFGDSPSIRVGHTCTFIPGPSPRSNGRLYVIGGANPSGAFCETFYLDLDTMQWDTVDFPGFRARYEHAAFVPSCDPKKIYVFGGADPTGNMNDVQVLDTTTNTWSTPDVSGQPPSPRTYHITAVCGDRFIVYGGGHSGPDPVPDRQVHCFDAKTCTWSVLPVKGDSPKPRHGHIMVAVENKLFIHGGMAGASFYEDLHVLDLDKMSWSNCRRKKTYPTARAAHSGIAIGTDLYIFGGMNRDGALDDLHKLDTVNMKWNKIELQGPPPACRLDFGMCMVTIHRPLPQEVPEDDILDVAVQAQEVVDRELKPGSASSRDSWMKPGSASSRESFSLRDLKPGSATSRDSRNDTGSECSGAELGQDQQVNDEKEEEDNDETPRPGQAGNDTDSVAPQHTMTMTYILTHGGMDTEGEIFDDTLVFLLPQSSMVD